MLNYLGFNLSYHKDQTCCGQPAITAGHIDAAKKMAKKFIKIFEQDECIVSPSGSCVSTVKNHYPKILKDEPEWKKRAEALGERIFELSQFLVDKAGIVDVNATYSGKVAYHHSCHLLRELGVKDNAIKLLSNIKGCELLPLNAAEECCGFGGQFSFKYPDISQAIVTSKINNFIASTADVLVVSDPGCLLNIGGYLHRHNPDKSVKHLVSILVDHLKKGGENAL